MTEPAHPAPASAVRDPYTLDYDQAVLAYFRQRTLAMCAPALLPHLRPGLTVLDIGCGPGSLTIELAEQVAPGQVVGIDRGTGQFEQARALAAERGVANIRFEHGDTYALAFPDASFDVVFSHALIGHLGEPMRAFAEMRRVLKPGGLVVASENDTETMVASPSGSAMEHCTRLMWRVQAHHGGLGLPARHLRGALREAGFVRTEAYPAAEPLGTEERTRLFAMAMVGILTRASAFQQTVLEQGWATAAELEAWPAELLAWGQHPDAFLGGLKVYALGWKPEGDS